MIPLDELLEIFLCSFGRLELKKVGNRFEIVLHGPTAESISVQADGESLSQAAFNLKANIEEEVGHGKQYNGDIAETKTKPRGCGECDWSPWQEGKAACINCIHSDPDPEILHDILLLVKPYEDVEPPSTEEISKWSALMKHEAIAWASATHYSASDNPGIKIPRKPDHVEYIRKEPVEDDFFPKDPPFATGEETR